MILEEPAIDMARRAVRLLRSAVTACPDLVVMNSSAEVYAASGPVLYLLIRSWDAETLLAGLAAMEDFLIDSQTRALVAGADWDAL
jgi:hypothetical protein